MSDSESSHAEQLEQKRAFWKRHIESWRTSGMRQVDYCRRHDLKGHQFAYWKKRFVRTDAGLTFVPLKNIPFAPKRRAILQSGALRLHVNNDFMIEIDPDFSPDLLSRVITTLQRLS